MLAGDSRQPHLTLVIGWRSGVDAVVVVKGTRRRPEGGQKILFSSTQQPCDEPAGEDCVCRLEPGDETGAWKGLRGGGVADLGMPAARQFTMCNTCLSAPTVPLCKAPFTVKMTEQFISCAGMIDMSYL